MGLAYNRRCRKGDVAIPNILLFGCHEQLVEALAADDRWSVAVGLHGEREKPALADALAPASDPRHWNLIVDDCAKENLRLSPRIFEQYRLRAHNVSYGYLSECGRAHGIRLCSAHKHHEAGLEPPSGHKTLEFNPVADTDALHLMDFVEEFGTSFTAGQIGVDYPDQFTPLFSDAYDDSVIGLYGDHFDWLFLIGIDDANRRNAALKYLCYRTALKLWPDIYSDSSRPKRVRALMQKKDEVIAKRRMLEEHIERQIQEEQAFYAPYVNLPYLGNDALKQLVQRVFQDVFGFETEDLDEKLEEGEPKRLDLLVRFPSASALAEVRSSGTRNARIDTDIERFDDNYEKSNERFGPAQGKILVFNGMYLRTSEQRANNPTFSEDVVAEAKARGITLVSSAQLLEVIESFRNEETGRDQVIEALSRPGLFQL